MIKKYFLSPLWIILGDPGAVGRVGRKGVRAKEPLGTDSLGTISKNQADAGS